MDCLHWKYAERRHDNTPDLSKKTKKRRHSLRQHHAMLAPCARQTLCYAIASYLHADLQSGDKSKEGEEKDKALRQSQETKPGSGGRSRLSLNMETINF